MIAPTKDQGLKETLIIRGCSERIIVEGNALSDSDYFKSVFERESSLSTEGYETVFYYHLGNSSHLEMEREI